MWPDSWRAVPQVHAQLGRNDVTQRGLAQAGRAEQQHMVERLTTLLGGADKYLQLLARLGLAHVFIEQLGAQRALQGFFLGRGGGGGDHAFGWWRGEFVGVDGHAR